MHVLNQWFPPYDFIGNNTILEPPQNLSTEVGSLATFTCTTTLTCRGPMSIIVWMFNGMNTLNYPRFNSSMDQGPDNSQIHTLTFIAQSEDDGSVIQCQILNSQNSTRNSTRAFLTLSRG